MPRDFLEVSLAMNSTADGNSAVEDPVPLTDLVQQTEQHFQQKFGRPPKWIVAAPGRVNLIGEHTDYNDGFVLPMAIEHYVVMAACESDQVSKDGSIRLHSTTVDQTESLAFDDCDVGQLAPWARYVYGVLVGCRQREMKCPALDVLIESTVPLGGGLSSSAALEVATATLVEAILGQSLERVEKALLCQKAEHDYAGVPCGIMDQFTSVMGQTDQLLLLDCRSTDIQMVPLNDPEIAVLIINTNVKHELTGGEYAERRSQCEAAAEKMGVPSLRDATLEMLGQNSEALEPVFYRRARHVIGEIGRTTEAAEGISAGDWARVGELMYLSHASLRDDYEVSCEELDLLVELARRHGDSGAVIGSRMTGGGFGGCTVSLVRKDRLAPLATAIRDDYYKETGIMPTLFTTRPAQGAQIVRG
jgi:galactokinase